MPDAVSQLGTVGGITKALLDALDQIENRVAASLVGPDGKPSGTAIYMHLPTGIPIDPRITRTPGRPPVEVRRPASATTGRLTPLRNRRPQRPHLPARPAPSILRRPNPTRNWKSP